MSLLYLLDTNILSEPNRKDPNPTIVKKLFQYEHQIATASPVYYELLTGTRQLPDSAKRKKLQAYLDGFIRTLPILPYDESSADWHASENVRLTQQGLTPAFVDAQIASIAATQYLTIVTRNVDDFSAFDGVRIENWFE